MTVVSKLNCLESLKSLFGYKFLNPVVNLQQDDVCTTILQEVLAVCFQSKETVSWVMASVLLKMG